MAEQAAPRSPSPVSAPAIDTSPITDSMSGEVVDPRKLRLAFFLTSYGPGEQLHRLVTTLRRAEPNAPIVIHHDRFQNELDGELFADDPDVHILTSDAPIVWGDMTLEAARWRVFRWILENLDIDWVVLLSEQDYPIKPLSALRERIAASCADAFILGERIDRVEDPERAREGEKRYLYQYTSLPSSGLEKRLPRPVARVVRPVRHMLFSAINRLQKRVLFYMTPRALGLATRVGVRPTPLFDDDFPCWVNDCWCTLSRTALEHLVRYLDEHPEFVRWYERTVIPLESATATVLFNDPELHVSNQTLHEIQWSSARDGRPDFFHEGDLGLLRESDAFFARKFSSDQPGVLDALDTILFPQPEKAL